jgi:hypothetical protein
MRRSLSAARSFFFREIADRAQGNQNDEASFGAAPS